MSQISSEDEFKTTIAEYLESLPTQFCQRVFSSPAACLAIFRLLSTVGKQLIMSMLYLKSPIRLQEIGQWAKPDHQRMVKSKIHQLRKLQLLVEEKGSVSLNPIFRKQLQNALTGGGDFSSFGVPYTGDDAVVSTKQLAKYANERWEAILHFMVGRSSQAHEMLAPLSESVRSILRVSKLMEGGPEGMTITNSGFQFLLQDSASQVWTVLLQYLKLEEMQNTDVVEVLNFLFQLVSLQLGRAYSTEALTRSQRKMLGELRDFGLIFQDNPKRFYPTHLITSLTSSGMSNDSVSDAVQSELTKSSQHGYIILETNCRVYAYTDSPLQIAILNLFVHLVSRFTNLVTGAVTRDSVRRALAHGITADQIITFLTSNAHPQMQGKTPVLPVTVTDQIRLWEQERNRLKPTSAFFYKGFPQRQNFERVLRCAQDMGVLLWANSEKLQMAVTLQGHARIAEISKQQRGSNAQEQ
ncbi:RNA polymerase II transcription factor B 52 kDa subunit [Coemansia sp. RSA 989]|nr:RNA polymerase II transcription factor B subunit 2 [Coemansia mojavensis]KAJ1865896.1 RNA polymerase II transcription factor B 52 kDa subunit [Coemansia sp. RSA 989]KAJ1873040.1 RNA polymerase II transcription factor B 52 kDa subunit [Coemansia sp. RSA 990]KAJ2632488.1 RNA polymerase II transcription factor B 52 kDa subunit [Coemansia sp. RSA 1290]KAJ2647840.1 RNA polymerase II transcription factor B 52 kDa subunit [Coemansia sp. RSA 1250]KAJ2673365.1 RNA polymerase II transcription factor 